MIKFKICHYQFLDYSYIILTKNDHYEAGTAHNISKIIGISDANYINILKRFGATKNMLGNFIFNKKSHAKKACNYLNEKYGVMLKLVGELDE